MKKLIYILFIVLAFGSAQAQTYLHTTVREEALSNHNFFSKLWIAEKGVYRIRLMIPEQQQVVVDTIPHEVIVAEMDTVQISTFEDPMMPPIEDISPTDSELMMGITEPMAEELLMSGRMSEPEISPIKIKPKPAPVLMVEDVKVLQLKRGTINTLELKDTTYWLVINGKNDESKQLKPTVLKEWECCYLIYEWIIEMDAEQYFEIWHNDRIKDFERGDWVEARDQYFSELSPGARIPDYYHGLILKVEAWKP